MQAWRLRDGRYALIDDRRNETYSRRSEIKRCGGRWYEELRRWEVPAAAVDRLYAHRVVGVICESVCCAAGGLEFRMVPEYEAQFGYACIDFCPYCDSRIHALATIIENLGEPPEARELWETEFRPQVEKWGGLAV
jgi:hypothetical protein